MYLIDDYEYGPPKQASLPLWLNAEKAITRVTGDKVSAWRDPRGGLGAVQATDALRPLIDTTTLGGRKCLQYSGGQSLAVESGIYGLSNANFTSYVVCAIDTNSQCTPYHGQSNSGGSFRHRMVYTGGTNMGGQNGNLGAANVTYLNTGADLGRIHLIELRSEGSDFSISIDGNTYSASFVGGDVNFIMQDLHLGSQGGSSNWLTGRIAEVLCYNEALNTSERNSVLDYVENLYSGLSLTNF